MTELEQHYSPKQLADVLGWSEKTIIRLFRDEPGVLILGRTESIYGKKRAYASIRIPASVAVRVAERMKKRATFSGLPVKAAPGARQQRERNASQ